ncbi:hypothetical protein MUK42_09705 [Musa troglodytarum]|uniref:Uncharacterized protein n=1 Tax=Musa troglodytarum TaxID=320322 RepID=A0A9E7J9J8_9LILI|nr:hypothetical protein MUK42_09705 [Musa troglodytarum]
MLAKLPSRFRPNHIRDGAQVSIRKGTTQLSPKHPRTVQGRESVTIFYVVVSDEDDVHGQQYHFLAKRPPKPPDFFLLGTETEVVVDFLDPVVRPRPLLSSTFLRMGSVSSSWSSFCSPPSIQSISPFSSPLLPAPFAAAVAANTRPPAAAAPIAKVIAAISFSSSPHFSPPPLTTYTYTGD